ncbi:hypothetical protein [Streptomyces viridochromogenes]|uniref:Uncharacterized protein n=1 Tax=Streptomyces viridochromogenes Tue57 TaxID=1160705 RepID=L8PNN5_STRVR|nr:hypothetical protein [Streptomyces viridochromogenes]ELS57664.1 hypothetical protein STVIR_1402 [Streptomyces viridochromogenes Tue57]
MRQTVEGGHGESHRPMEAGERHVVLRGSLPMGAAGSHGGRRQDERLRAVLGGWFAASAHRRREGEPGRPGEPSARHPAQRGPADGDTGSGPKP